MLKDTKLLPGFPMEQLAELTEGLSGSDLRELCRNAAMVPVREYMRSASLDQELLSKGQQEVCNARPRSSEEDFIRHFYRVSTSGRLQ